MNPNKIVNPSDQTQALLPLFIGENYQTFVGFMQRAAESQERAGFGQDLLQNLQRYRDFDTYAAPLAEYGVLSGGLSEDEEDEIHLENGVGFPLENGVVLIDNEVILYRTRSGNVLEDLQRGASATTVLPSVYAEGVYSTTEAGAHTVGSEVKNISALFLSAMLTTIHESFSPGIHKEKVNADINRSILLQNIKQFYGSKGSKLGIEALFRFIFGETDIDVIYPGDLMLRASGSSWQEFLIGTTTPFPLPLLGTYQEPFTTSSLLGAQLTFKDYLDGSVLGTAVSEFATQYVTPEGVRYSIYLDADSYAGRQNIATPTTILKRDADYFGSSATITSDVFTITVDSTVGFPESGMIFIGDEGITYTSKSNSQFFGCVRGVAGRANTHSKGSIVFGSKYVEITVLSDGSGRTTSCWLNNVYKAAEVRNKGILAKMGDPIAVGEPGDTDYRSVPLATLQENTNDELVEMVTQDNITDVSDNTQGISAVYFNEDRVLAASSGLPGYPIGPFSNDGSVGPDLKSDASAIHVIPKTTQPNSENILTGSGFQGLFVDGTPALSVRSGQYLVFGEITEIKVLNGGINYGTTTLIIEDSIAEGTVTTKGGVIQSASITTNDHFTAVPTVRVTEGEGALFDLTFDQFGRLTNVTIVSGGNFYFDTPTLFLDDETGIGSGAVVVCTVSELGSINSVEILNAGLDYNPSASTLRTVTPGSGCVLQPMVETWTYNRVTGVDNSATESFDNGNGMIASIDGGQIKDTFGYPQIPKLLIEEMDGNLGDRHSSLIGWAYDGNPIYGPVGYLNGVDESSGVIQLASGWVLNVDRSGITPMNQIAGFAANNPPSTDDYPMGTFIEDYRFDPDNVSIVGRLMTELDERLQTDPDNLYLRYEFEIGSGILDIHNGRVCNTPEFPASQYPDGVYCYFVTRFGQNGTFPYIIGPEFRDRPITQNLVLRDKGVVLWEQNGSANYADAVIQQNFNLLRRNRNLSIPTATTAPVMKYETIQSGGVDGVVVVEGSPNNATVRDQFYFDNTGTDGTGAVAVVKELVGETVEDARGDAIESRVISHNQRIALENVTGTVGEGDELETVSPDDFVFAKGSIITTVQGSSAVVVDWSYDTYYLDVKTTTERLIRFGDRFVDNTGTTIEVPASKYPSNTLLFADQAGVRNTHASWEEPDASEATPGDLWWSAKTGRLYVYFQDANSSQWVTTQPSGSRSFYDAALDVPVGTTASTTQAFASPQGETKITLSTMGPSERADNTPNQPGDLWWSTHTGMLYIWVSEAGEEQNSQWVATDPTASLLGGDTVGQTSQLGNTPANNTTYSQSVEVLISEASPATMNDGSALVPGTLWWSPASGKMYIYYTDVDTSQWVVTNPTTSQTGPSALGYIVSNDGSGPDFIGLLPVPAAQEDIWFEPTFGPNDFQVGDTVEFRFGAPGGGADYTDTGVIEAFTNDYGRFLIKRSDNPIDLPHGTAVTNVTRSYYVITTDVPHNLQNGDEVRISGSAYDEVNGKHLVHEAGGLTPAQFTAQVVNGEVTGVLIDDGGSGYGGDGVFPLFFHGGGGLGADAVAFADGKDGMVSQLDILNPGTGYVTANAVQVTSNGDGTGLIVDIVAVDGAITNITIVAQGENYVPSELITIPGGSNAEIEVNSVTEFPFGSVYQVTMLNGGSGYTSAPSVTHDTLPTTSQFILTMSETYPAESGISYVTSSETVEGTPSTIRMISNGLGYLDLPAVIGLTRSSDKAAKAEAVLSGTSISAVVVNVPGNSYVNPIAIVEDITGSGSGAELSVNIDEIGAVTSVNVINPGTDYVEPQIFFVEQSGNYVATTKTIGGVGSVVITDIGEGYHDDITSEPEVLPYVRLVIDYDGDPFLNDEEVFQGSETNKLVTGTVVSYNPRNQVLTLKDVDGFIVNTEKLVGVGGRTADILACDAPYIELQASGFSSPEGQFIDGTGSPSDIGSVIQDSYYYQNFSYVISSAMQRDAYEDIVNTTVHPSGMLMFSEVLIESEVETEVIATEAIVD